MPHDHGHGHGHAPDHPHGHNHAADHLHSHPLQGDEGLDLQSLTQQFIDGFQTAADKTAFLRLARVPFEIADAAGGPSLKLVDVRLATEWQVATASPAFGSRELSHLPFPGSMVKERTNMAFVYVSLDRRQEVDLRTHLGALAERAGA